MEGDLDEVAAQVHVSHSAATLPWVEKYRPVGLEDVVSHHDIINTGSIIVLYNITRILLIII